MTKIITAFLIDVDSKEIKKIKYKSKLIEIYKLLNCSCIDRIYLENGLCVYIDDEGNFTDKNSFYATLKDGSKIEIVGNGLVVDTDFDIGETISVDCSIDEVKKYIEFSCSEFNEWIRTFFLEKNISLLTQLESGHTLRELLKILDYQPLDVTNEIKNKIVEIDLVNGDILHFMNYLSRGIR